MTLTYDGLHNDQTDDDLHNDQHTLIFNFKDMGTFRVGIKVEIKIIQYVCIPYITLTIIG